MLAHTETRLTGRCGPPPLPAAAASPRAAGVFFKPGERFRDLVGSPYCGWRCPAPMPSLATQLLLRLSCRAVAFVLGSLSATVRARALSWPLLKRAPCLPMLPATPADVAPEVLRKVSSEGAALQPGCRRPGNVASPGLLPSLTDPSAGLSSCPCAPATMPLCPAELQPPGGHVVARRHPVHPTQRPAALLGRHRGPDLQDGAWAGRAAAVENP
jgi:hypothetical protein